jgi:hypothetical protein
MGGYSDASWDANAEDREACSKNKEGRHDIRPYASSVVVGGGAG